MCSEFFRRFQRRSRDFKNVPGMFQGISEGIRSVAMVFKMFLRSSRAILGFSGGFMGVLGNSKGFQGVPRCFRGDSWVFLDNGFQGVTISLAFFGNFIKFSCR